VKETPKRFQIGLKVVEREEMRGCGDVKRIQSGVVGEVR
jgi:hypothetical protein